MRRYIKTLIVSSTLLFTTHAFSAEAPEPAEQPAEQTTEQVGGRGSVRAVANLFKENCAVCHGEQLEGAALGTPLVGHDLLHGDQIADVIDNIAAGFADKGMPAWSKVLTEQEIKGLALWIIELRENITMSDFRLTKEIEIPADPIKSELHDLRLEVVVENLDPIPYSIAPLADGQILLTEKMRGLRVISAQGEVGAYITGTPKVYDDVPRPNSLDWGQGRMLDVKPHPNYAENGWIYLHYTERCNDCNELSKKTNKPVSMNALVRGKIKDGAWVDQQTIYRAPIETYSGFTDLAAGGRTAFDPEGYVFISVGTRGRSQDLSAPDGKIHRLHDDGRVPVDNPYVEDSHALSTIWSYGHRSPQGLEFNAKTGELWGSEHGPRGGDEVNLLKPKRNYGWPAFSKGQNYDGTEVNRSRDELELELKDIEQPVVDFTPSPAISSFVFYQGEAFPKWRDHLIVASLKAADLYRVEINNNTTVKKEVLIDNLARIRDVEIGPAGEIFLLLEHTGGGKIVKVVPADKGQAIATLPTLQ
jgi:glucose/arabinose dehydrogenase